MLVIMQLLPNYFKTLGEGPVREKSPAKGIDPLTSQSRVIELSHSTIQSLSLSLSLSLSSREETYTNEEDCDSSLDYVSFEEDCDSSS